MSERLTNKQSVFRYREDKRLLRHLLMENIQRLKLYTPIATAFVILYYLVSTAQDGRLIGLGAPVLSALYATLSMTLYFSHRLNDTARLVTLNLTHALILLSSIMASAFSAIGSDTALTIYTLCIMLCAVALVRYPPVMIGSYIAVQICYLAFRYVNTARLDLFEASVSAFISIVACMSAVLRYARAKDIFEEKIKIQQLNEQLEFISSTDKLTGLANRKKMDEELSRLIEMTRKCRSPLSVILLDIDNFKQINDTHGHVVGDQVMRAVAEVIRCSTRQKDVVGRWGGDEFLIICPQMELPKSMLLAERIKEAVAQAELPLGVKVTISGGIGQIGSDETDLTLFSRIDEALYAAKLSGRNRMEASFDDDLILHMT